MADKNTMTHEEVVKNLKEELEWPRYYVSGEDVDIESFVPAYYRVEGPNGPVSYVNPNSGPFPATMSDLVMEAQNRDFRECRREETPWTDHESK